MYHSCNPVDAGNSMTHISHHHQGSFLAGSENKTNQADEGMPHLAKSSDLSNVSGKACAKDISLETAESGRHFKYWMAVVSCR